MKSEFENLQKKWDKGKDSIAFNPKEIDGMLDKIVEKKRATFFMYYTTISVLLVTLIIISLFFYYVAPVQHLLSQIGVGLMTVGLTIRIAIEVFSIVKAKKIGVADNALKTANNTIAFYKLRKTIQGVIAPIIIILYTIGFYMITPEFSLYLSLWAVILIDVSYIFIAIILFVQIRKSVKKELENLQNIIKLRKEIMN